MKNEELTIGRSPDDICNEQSFLSILETATPRPVAQEHTSINEVRKSVEPIPQHELFPQRFPGSTHDVLIIFVEFLEILNRL